MSGRTSRIAAALALWAMAVGVAAVGAGSPEVAGAAADPAQPARLEFVDPDLRPVPAQALASAQAWRQFYPRAGYPGSAVWLAFGIAPGRPAGLAASRPYLRILLAREPPLLERRHQGAFEIDLGRAQRELAAAATSLAGAPEDDGLAAAPADCRIARLVLGLFDTLHYPMAAMVGFVDGGEQLALLYTDRPCRITGTIALQRSGSFVDLDPALRERFAGRYEHDIDTPSAGLHWLRVRRLGPGTFSVTRTELPAGTLAVFALRPGVGVGAAPAGRAGLRATGAD